MPGQAQPKGGQQVAPPKRSFLVGTQTVVEGADYDQTVINSPGGAFAPWSLTATGFLKEIVLDFTYTVAGNAVVTVAVTENFPFNILGNIQLNDINNEAIFGPFDSYTAMLTNKYGGYANYEDPATAATTLHGRADRHQRGSLLGALYPYHPAGDRPARPDRCRRVREQHGRADPEHDHEYQRQPVFNSADYFRLAASARDAGLLLGA